MDAKLANLLQTMMYDDGFDCDVRDDYSGRCMYGKETHAITGDFSLSDVLSVVLERVRDGWLTEDDLRDVKRFGLSQDSMGLGVVIY